MCDPQRLKTGRRDSLRTGGERPHPPYRRVIPPPRPQQPQNPRPPRKYKDLKRPRLRSGGCRHNSWDLEYFKNSYLKI